MKKLVILVLSVLLFSSWAMGVPRDSLYNLDSTWEDNTGLVKKFSGLQSDKYKVVTMIFTSCPAACPLMVSHLQQMDKALTAEQKKNVEFLLFSIDPLDTTEKLQTFHEKFSLDERFKFLRSSDEDVIQELAAVLGFKYKKVSESMYSHGTDVYVLNPEGEVIGKVGQSYKAKDNLVKLIK